MKKLVLVFTVAILVCLFAFSAFAASGNDWGVTATVDKTDGSVTVSALAEDIIAAEADLSQVAWLYVCVYDENPNYTAESEMDANLNAIVGPGNVGRLDNSLLEYKINVGPVTANQPKYPFVEGETYYIYIFACDGISVWVANYVPVVLNYTTSDATPVPTDPGGDTADLSMLAYALAAISGCGALTLVARKK